MNLKVLSRVQLRNLQEQAVEDSVREGVTTTLLREVKAEWSRRRREMKKVNAK